jgi:hypothetical protein
MVHRAGHEPIYLNAQKFPLTGAERKSRFDYDFQNQIYCRLIVMMSPLPVRPVGNIQDQADRT